VDAQMERYAHRRTCKNEKRMDAALQPSAETGGINLPACKTEARGHWSRAFLSTDEFNSLLYQTKRLVSVLSLLAFSSGIK
jgi:hypothetical protein